MNKYFIVNEGQQRGPFTIDELKSESITPTTLVWNNNLENWTEASKVIELGALLNFLPPPIPNEKIKTIKIEAELVNKREKTKVVGDKTKSVIASEITTIFKYIFYSICIGLISLPIIYSFIENQTKEEYRTFKKNYPEKIIDKETINKALRSLTYTSKMQVSMRNKGINATKASEYLNSSIKNAIHSGDYASAIPAIKEFERLNIKIGNKDPELNRFISSLIISLSPDNHEFTPQLEKSNVFMYSFLTSVYCFFILIIFRYLNEIFGWVKKHSA